MKPTRREKLAHLDAALAHVKSFRLAVDVGAHVGLWTKVLAERFDAVIAFEPFLPNVERFEKNVQASNVLLSVSALGDREGMAYLTFEEKSRRSESMGSHSKHFVTWEEPAKRLDAGHVVTRTLDSFELQSLDFLKVDTEGADTLVLRGAEETLQRCRPVVIVESIAKYETRYGLQPGAPVDFLESLGAKCVANMWHDYICVFP